MHTVTTKDPRHSHTHTPTRFTSLKASIEVIPLVLEPDSQFYTDPVLVLDFQSLYPSMILAYNLCYSTILGRLTRPGDARGPTTGKLGFTPYPAAKTAANLAECGVGAGSSCAGGGGQSGGQGGEGGKGGGFGSGGGAYSTVPNVLPTGAVFCGRGTREGVLPRMLREILETRFMVKRAAKRCLAPGNGLSPGARRALANVLHARQFALKMIANVTYGYTAAGFSGRMPCAELADAIVKAGRSTLEHAIGLVEAETERWSGAKVVYGDTDSLFVHLPGKSMAEAFAAGRAIATAVTDANPKDVVLKFEKVCWARATPWLSRPSRSSLVCQPLGAK